MDQRMAAKGFGLLAEPNRLEVLRLLSQGEHSAAGLLEHLPVSQPTLSHHMQLLCEGGLVERRRQGQRVIYTLCLPALRELLAFPLGPLPEAPPFIPTPPPGPIIRSGHKSR